MGRVMYRGYEIQAVPFWSRRLNGWQVNVYVAKANDGQVEMKHYSSDLALLSKETALRECFEFGKKIVQKMSVTKGRVLATA